MNTTTRTHDAATWRRIMTQLDKQLRQYSTVGDREAALYTTICGIAKRTNDLDGEEVKTLTFFRHTAAIVDAAFAQLGPVTPVSLMRATRGWASGPR